MRRAVAACAVGLLLAGAFALGFFLTRAPLWADGQESRPTPFTPDPTIPAGAMSPAESKTLAPTPINVRVQNEVRALLHGSYVEQVAPEVLAEETVEGMVAALDDPYTEYLSPEEYGRLRSRTGRSYTGVGLTVGRADQGLLVTSALRGPAREAGIQRGDIILRIDGRSARKMAFEDSLASIKGEEGTPVRLTVRRPKEGKLDFTLVREEVPVPSIRKRMVRMGGTKLAYVRILAFPESSGERVEWAVDRLVGNGAQGLILDLRDNPGGLLGQAVHVASLFLDEGVVCSVENVHQGRTEYESTGRAAHPDLPVVILVNKGTASSAEILASALKQHGRAKVIGERTFGKASIQSLYELANGAALKLTTSTYRTASGRDLTAHGVVPDLLNADNSRTRHDEALVGAGLQLRHELVLLAQLH